MSVAICCERVNACTEFDPVSDCRGGSVASIVLDIAFGFLIKNQWVALTGPTTAMVSQELTLGSFNFQPWIAYPGGVPAGAGTWTRLSADIDNVAFYLTGDGGDLAVSYSIVPGGDQPFTLVTPTPTGVKGPVMVWRDFQSSPGGGVAVNQAHLLQVGSTDQIASTVGNSGSATSPFLTWIAQLGPMPITREWGAMIEDNFPYHSGNGGRTVILPRSGTSYVYTDNATPVSPLAFHVGTCIDGDWADVRVSNLGPRQMMAVGRKGGANLFQFLPDDSTPNAWVSMAAPVGWNPVAPRIIWVEEGVVDPGADGAWMALDGSGALAYSDQVGGVPGAWAMSPTFPAIAGAIWTGLDVSWAGPQLRVIIIGTVAGVPALMVSNNAFAAPFTVSSWTQKDFTVKPY